jgi:hypothetical protein
MYVPLLKLCARDVNALQISLVRYGHHIRGKPPGVARNLKQRLEGKLITLTKIRNVIYETYLQENILVIVCYLFLHSTVWLIIC